MVELRDRIAAIQAALAEEQDVKFADPPARHSLDHRFDSIAPEVDVAPAPTPARERTNPFESIDVPATSAALKPQFYDSIAQKFGLGILDEDEFVEYVVYDASLTNLRVCPLNMADHSHYYYVDYRFSLPNVPGVVLREGTEKTGKSLGAAHIPIQGENRLGVGDYDKTPHKMVWEKMGNKGFWTHMKYEFEHETVDGKRRVFHWIRTRNNIMDDQGDLVLVEEGKEQLVLCEYLGKGLLKWKKRGRLRVRTMEKFGLSWEIIVLLSWASVVEMSRRRARYRRYSPTHLIGI